MFSARQSFFALCLVLVATSHAFSPSLARATHSRTEALSIRYSTEDPNEISKGPAAGDPAPLPVQPPVPQQRLDPLMASLTRMDPGTGDGPTKNVPFFGEVAVDGGLVVLIPAALIAILGGIMSVVVAVNSSDQLVAALSNVADDIAQTASEKTNMVYDDSVCRGICSSQEEDLKGLATFMESLRKQ